MAKAHLGSKNCNHQMLKYVYRRRQNGVHIIDARKLYEKIVFAARVIAAVPDAKDVCVISGRTYGQRAVLKFSKHVGCHAIAGRFTPGTFTNQIQRAFQEPRLLIVSDPYVDHQPVREASYVNLPTIGLCSTDTPLRYIDIVLPCNNKAVHSVGLVWWMLARQVLRLRGTLAREDRWDIMPDLYFYRAPDEIERQEAAQEAAKAEYEEQTETLVAEWDTAPVEGAAGGDWGQPPAEEWPAS